MKKLTEIEKEIKKLREEIFCQENGNDLYFSSALYQKHLLELQALETEKLVLNGKLSPMPIDFDEQETPKRKILNQMAQTNGYWYADYHRNLTLDDLQHIKNNRKIKSL